MSLIFRLVGKESLQRCKAKVAPPKDPRFFGWETALLNQPGNSKYTAEENSLDKALPTITDKRLTILVWIAGMHIPRG